MCRNSYVPQVSFLVMDCFGSVLVLARYYSIKFLVLTFLVLPFRGQEVGFF